MRTAWTEEEARTKVCHLTMSPAIPHTACCAASGCMAWRWARPGKIIERRTFADDADFDAFLNEAPEGWEERWPDMPLQERREQWVRRDPPTVGYCGRIEGNT